MPRLEGGPHGLKADPSARADDQDYRHGVMLPVGPAWLTVMCDAGSCTARWAGGLKSVSRAVAVPSQNLTQVTPPPREFHPLALAVIGRRRHLRAEVADEVGGRGRVVGIDAD